MSNLGKIRRLSEKTIFVSKNRKYVVNEVVDVTKGQKITKLFRKTSGLGSVAIIPLLNGNRILLIRQYRPAVRFEGNIKEDGWIYELPGGKVEEGETVEAAARRELEEETGYKAREIIFLYDRYSAPWAMDSIDSLCIATKLTKTHTKQKADEMISIVPTKVSKIIRILKNGELKDLSTREGLLYWLEFIHKHKKQALF